LKLEPFGGLEMSNIYAEEIGDEAKGALMVIAQDLGI
jgi:hypothetical protein